MVLKSIKSGRSWIIELGEGGYDAESGIDPVALEVYREQARKNNCTNLTIFVVPDPILPLCGFAAKTRVHTETLKFPNGTTHEIRQSYEAEIPLDHWQGLSVSEQTALLRKVRDELAVKGHKNPGRATIFYMNSRGGYEYLWQGRV